MRCTISWNLLGTWLRDTCKQAQSSLHLCGYLLPTTAAYELKHCSQLSKSGISLRLGLGIWLFSPGASLLLSASTLSFSSSAMFPLFTSFPGTTGSASLMRQMGWPLGSLLLCWSSCSLRVAHSFLLPLPLAFLPPQWKADSAVPPPRGPGLHPVSVLHTMDKQVTGSPVAPSGPLPSSLGLYWPSYTLGLHPLQVFCT